MSKKPNIIFYFSDQQRWDTLGCYGQKLDVSPTLDALAKEGVRFEHAYTCQPVCGPARACLQTGKFATEIGCYKNGIQLPLDATTLANCFNDAGYETAYVGKWHLASDHAKKIDYKTTAIPEKYRGGYKDYWMASDVLEFTSHGYDGFVFDKDNNRHDFIGYRADCINNYAVHYLQNRKTDNPFFLFISQIEPHHQNDRNIFEGPDGSKERFKDYEVPKDLEGTGGDWEANYPDYLGQCRSLDDNVGRLIDTLKSQGEWENTILIYTADHGSHFCTRNGEYKRSCHDASLRVPLIIHGPHFEGGKVEENLVSLMDLPATMLDCAGISKPEDWQGRSLKQLVETKDAPWDEEIFAQISESQIGRCIRTKDYKYSVRAKEDGKNNSCADVYYEDFLYDLTKDPAERNNLVSNPEFSEVRQNLAKRLCKWMNIAGEKEPKILPCEEA